MNLLRLNNVGKRFDNGTEALSGLGLRYCGEVSRG